MGYGPRIVYLLNSLSKIQNRTTKPKKVRTFSRGSPPVTLGPGVGINLPLRFYVLA